MFIFFIFAFIVFIIILAVLLKFVPAVLKNLDYLVVGCMPFLVAQVFFDYDLLFSPDVHTVFKILIGIAPVAGWWALVNFVHIGNFYPFKWIGALFCGITIGCVVWTSEEDLIWSIAAGIVGTVFIGASRIDKKPNAAILEEHEIYVRHDGFEEGPHADYMICPNCSWKTTDNATFCQKCASPLSISAEV